MPAPQFHLANGLDAQCVVQPALDEVRLELATFDDERIAVAPRRVGHPREDRPTVPFLEPNPGRERELVVEAERRDVARVDEAGPVERRRLPEPTGDERRLAGPERAAARI